jgi:hypothetical protein
VDVVLLPHSPKALYRAKRIYPFYRREAAFIGRQAFYRPQGILSPRSGFIYSPPPWEGAGGSPLKKITNHYTTNHYFSYLCPRFG